MIRVDHLHFVLRFEPAIRGYEIRWGEVWESALFMKLDLDPTLTLIGVRPGLHMFWGNPIANAGPYAAKPVSAQCRVLLPPGLTLHQSWSWDFNAIGTPTFRGCDISYCSNADSGANGGGQMILRNCIVRRSAGSTGTYDLGTGSLTITYSNIQDGYSGTGNIDANPLFVNPGAGDFALSASSACRNAGDNTVWSGTANVTDLIGEAPQMCLLPPGP